MVTSEKVKSEMYTTFDYVAVVDEDRNFMEDPPLNQETLKVDLSDKELPGPRSHVGAKT